MPNHMRPRRRKSICARIEKSTKCFSGGVNNKWFKGSLDVEVGLFLTVVDRHFHHHSFHVSVWCIREPLDAHCTRPLTSTGSLLTCNSTWQRIRIWLNGGAAFPILVALTRTDHKMMLEVCRSGIQTLMPHPCVRFGTMDLTAREITAGIGSSTPRDPL